MTQSDKLLFGARPRTGPVPVTPAQRYSWLEERIADRAAEYWAEGCGLGYVLTVAKDESERRLSGIGFRPTKNGLKPLALTIAQGKPEKNLSFADWITLPWLAEWQGLEREGVLEVLTDLDHQISDFCFAPALMGQLLQHCLEALELKIVVALPHSD